MSGTSQTKLPGTIVDSKSAESTGPLIPLPIAMSRCHGGVPSIPGLIREDVLFTDHPPLSERVPQGDPRTLKAGGAKSMLTVSGIAPMFVLLSAVAHEAREYLQRNSSDEERRDTWTIGSREELAASILAPPSQKLVR